MFLGPRDTFPLVYPQLAGINLEAQVSRLEMPVWLMLGREDFVTPSEIAARYFDRLETPRKTLVWFEHSGHSPQFEEPGKFNSVLTQQVRAVAAETRPDALLH
jgi:pimeloyl-ACP methyl ester carboxylesterase